MIIFMREILSQDITATVKRLCIEANYNLPVDIQERLCQGLEEEPWPLAQDILTVIKDNYTIAAQKGLPICQDTGIACVFIKMGQDTHVKGSLKEAIHEGVRQGYKEGCLRNSVVADPVFRGNTGDNTPAMIYFDVVEGDCFEIMVAPKGFGSENMSRVMMLKPSDGMEGIKNFVIETIKLAGSNPCPPIVVGVGIGGTFDKVALLAKEALMRDTNVRNSNPQYAQVEAQLLEAINNLGIGPQGVGGKTTALAVNIETLPTHIAGMPAAVNINCHVTRHKSAKL